MLTTLFTTDAMRAIFGDRARIQRMLDVEAALAAAEARAGVIPADAASAIAACCRAELYDLDALAKAARNAGNLAIPLVSALTRKVGEDGSAAKGYVHWGATSQDIIDTGLVLQLRDALAAIERDVGRLGDALRLQIDRHRTTVMPGRTWLQQGLPTTLGLEARRRPLRADPRPRPARRVAARGSWCCNSAARRARSRRWARRALRSSARWPTRSRSTSRPHPGTRSATGCASSPRPSAS